MLRPAFPALSTVLLASLLHAQEKRPTVSPEGLRKGAGLLFHQFDPNEDPMPLIKRFEWLRVADVVDALPPIGIQDETMMEHDIRPLWRDNSNRIEHRVYGAAVTYQYVPTNRLLAGPMEYEKFKQWHSHW